MAAQQFETGFPVVVPEPFGLEGIDAGWFRPPARVVLHGFRQGAAVAPADVPDDAVNVEEKNGGWGQGGWCKGLVG
jgi:hypothetical protein